MNYLSRLEGVFDHCYAKDVVFRPFCRSDGFPLFIATQNPEFNRYALWSAPSEELAIFIQVDKLIRDQIMNRAIVLSICEKSTGKWLGLATIRDFLDGMQMGLYLHPDVWGRRVVFSAGGAILETLVKTYSELPIYIRVRPGNQRMERLVDYFYFEKQPQQNIETHETEGQVMSDIYRLDKKNREKFAHISDY